MERGHTARSRRIIHRWLDVDHEESARFAKAACLVRFRVFSGWTVPRSTQCCLLFELFSLANAVISMSMRFQSKCFNFFLVTSIFL